MIKTTTCFQWERKRNSPRVAGLIGPASDFDSEGGWGGGIVWSFYDHWACDLNTNFLRFRACLCLWREIKTREKFNKIGRFFLKTPHRAGFRQICLLQAADGRRIIWYERGGKKVNQHLFCDYGVSPTKGRFAKNVCIDNMSCLHKIRITFYVFCLLPGGFPRAYRHVMGMLWFMSNT